MIHQWAKCASPEHVHLKIRPRNGDAGAEYVQVLMLETADVCHTNSRADEHVHVFYPYTAELKNLEKSKFTKKTFDINNVT